MSTTPKTLTITECHQLLDSLIHKNATGPEFRRSVRNYTMTIFMLDAGLRVGEVVQLRVPDILYNGEPVDTLTVRAAITKRHRERLIPLSSRIKNAIAEMNKVVWSKDVATTMQYAFYLNYARQHITVRQVERIIRSAGRRSIGRDIHPHVLRHTFGSKLMRLTNARIVQELLGHKNLATTQIYTHPNGEDLKNAIDNLNS